MEFRTDIASCNKERPYRLALCKKDDGFPPETAE